MLQPSPENPVVHTHVKVVKCTNQLYVINLLETMLQATPEKPVIQAHVKVVAPVEVHVPPLAHG